MAPKRQQAVAAVPPAAVEDNEDDLYMPRSPNHDVSTSDQHTSDTTISDMVVEVMAECPAAGTSWQRLGNNRADLFHKVHKFRVTNPKILEKAAKEHERKAKVAAQKNQPQAQKRRAPGMSSNTVSDSEEGENKERDGKNKKKKSNTEGVNANLYPLE